MSVTAAPGFTAAGVASGIKPSGDLDLALVATEDGLPVSAAAVFTANKATAAPVQVSRSHLQASKGRAAAVLLNSGNANAATGEVGRDTAVAACTLVAQGLKIAPRDVLVCSTGLIGIPLPIEPFERGVPVLLAGRSADGGADAARAIMTTDTHPKEAVARGKGFTVGGMAKGAAMLAPNMATMLAVITTDVPADPVILKAALTKAVNRSFNAMSIDGCTSTNDTVIVLSNGRSRTATLAAFTDALTEVCVDLASQMVGDAEGATKVVKLTVTGARNADEARRAARQVAESQLVKCSWYGSDPYWGRIVSELGVAGVGFDPDLVTVRYGGVTVCRGGVAAEHDGAALEAHMQQRHLEVVADLGLGEGEATILTNDLTHAYIDENMRTS